jgi:hypothetical protein
MQESSGDYPDAESFTIVHRTFTKAIRFTLPRRKLMFPHENSSPIDAAKKCFEENLRNFGDALTNPEKYNLYNGLSNLATAIAELRQKVSSIDSAVDRIVKRR